MKVREIMSTEVRGIREDGSLSDAALQMQSHDVGCLPVTSPDGTSVVGILTDRDIVVRSVASGENPREVTAGQAMSSPLVCCRADDDVAQAVASMKAKRVRRVLVLDSDDEPVGVVSVGDLTHSDIDDEVLSSVIRNLAPPRRPVV